VYCVCLCCSFYFLKNALVHLHRFKNYSPILTYFRYEGMKEAIKMLNGEIEEQTKGECISHGTHVSSSSL
jgi:hypothetical protein